MKRRFLNKWLYGVIAFLIFVPSVGYWVKCQLGINLFDHMSISKYFPFNYLQDDVLSPDQPGVVFQDSFDGFRFFNQWSDKMLLNNYPGTSKTLVKGGIGKDSRCLLITSETDNRWSYPFRKFIAVSQGDRFHFEGEIYLEEKTSPAMLYIAAFDAGRKNINWGLARKGTGKTGLWIKVEKNFNIEDDRIRYITFRLVGGKGTYRFDNLRLEVLSKPTS